MESYYNIAMAIITIKKSKRCYISWASVKLSKLIACCGTLRPATGSWQRSNGAVCGAGVVAAITVAILNEQQKEQHAAVARALTGTHKLNVAALDVRHTHIHIIAVLHVECGMW